MGSSVRFWPCVSCDGKKRVETSITAFRSPKFRQIRAALVETDGPTQVLNFIMFPDLRY